VLQKFKNVKLCKDIVKRWGISEPLIDLDTIEALLLACERRDIDQPHRNIDYRLALGSLRLLCIKGVMH
jgi:hypothetical protein